MTIWGIAYITALAGASAIGRDWRIIAAMWANLGLTLTYAGQDMFAVAIADLICAVWLSQYGGRERVIGALFAAMVPVYLVGGLLAWGDDTTYGVVEVVAYLQCGVLARVDRGGAGLVGWYRRAAGAIRPRNRRAFVWPFPVASRSDAEKDM